MALIETKNITNDALKSFDDFMVQATLGSGSASIIACAVWSDVLRELDKRGELVLVDGSYDDAGNASIKRLWLTNREH